MSFEVLQEFIRAPRAILGFGGWPDAGGVVAQVASALRRSCDHQLTASWNLDGYWHTGVQRPRVTVEHGRMRRLSWPSFDFFTLSPPQGDPVLLGMGMEPCCRWRKFAQELFYHLNQWECQEIVLLGSLYDQVFYDEVVISAVARDVWGMNLMRELECRPVEYEGPSGIQGWIMEAAPSSGMRCLCLWSHMPSYLQSPHELILARYLEKVGQLAGVRPDTWSLMERWRDRVREIEELLRENEELDQLVQLLKNKEESVDDAPDASRKVVSLEEFLKKRRPPESDPF